MTLREWRTMRGYTIREAAAALGLRGPGAHTVYSSWELGSRTPRLGTALRIQVMTRGLVTMNDLAGGVSEMLEAS
jgi:transcriptional regulator with XRE-family HTH domain